MTQNEIQNGTVVWFRDAGLGVRGIVNGDPREALLEDGTHTTLYPVHQPQTNQNLIVWADNIYRIGERP
jgi:hypothetical protein